MQVVSNATEFVVDVGLCCWECVGVAVGAGLVSDGCLTTFNCYAML